MGTTIVSPCLFVTQAYIQNLLTSFGKLPFITSSHHLFPHNPTEAREPINLLKHSATKPSILASQDGGRMERASQREVIVIDATPTPDPEPGGARLQDTIQSAAASNGEGGSQRPSQSIGYV